MSENLLGILKGLTTDPSLVIGLYQELFNSKFFTLVLKGTEEDVIISEFLIYDTGGNIRELPLFTHKSLVFANYPADAIVAEFSGQPFWERLLTIIETGKLEAAVDPSQAHGIRLTREMIMGMIAKYGTSK